MRYVKDESGRVLPVPNLNIRLAAACRHEETITGTRCRSDGSADGNSGMYMTICKRCGRIIKYGFK